jgi:hypothetical protein
MSKMVEVTDTKRSQMEIMGLAIVVILFTIGMLFVVKLNIGKKPTGYKAEFTREQLVSNTLNALLNSNARDCSGMSISELLQDCGQVNPQVYCNGVVSCQYVKNTAEEIFSKTLDKWNYKYHFLVYFPDEEPIIELGEKCIGDTKSETFPISTPTKPLNTRLDLCG